MNCPIALEFLQQRLDGSSIESPEWLDHLRDCGECRSLTSASRLLLDGLRLVPAPQPPADLAARIVASIRRQRRRAHRRAWIYGTAASALAAGLLLALTLSLQQSDNSVSTHLDPSVSVAKNAAGLSVATPKPGKEDESAPTLRQSAEELGEVLALLGNQTADETLGQTRRLAANVPTPSLPKVDLTAMEPPTRPLRAAGANVSEGLEPVTTSARRAVNLFLRELPMETEKN